MGKAQGAAAPPASPSSQPSSVTGPPPSRPRVNAGRLGEILVKEGVVTPGQLEEALQQQSGNGRFLGQVLVELGFITQATLVSFLVKQCKIPHISLVDYVVSEDLFKLVPKELCLKHNLLPIDKLGRILTLAMVDPLDVEALEEVRKSCPDIKIKPILCDWNHFDSVARKVFHTEAREIQEVTAGSFGLSEQKSRPKPKEPDKQERTAVDAAVDALVKEAAATVKREAKAPPRADGGSQKAVESSRPVKPAPPSAPATPVEAADSQVTDSIRAVLHEALAPLLAASARTDAPPWDAKAFQSGIRDSLQEVIAPLLAEQQKLSAARSSDSTPPPDPKMWAGQVSQELRDSVLAGLDTMLRAQRDESPRGAAMPQPDELARLIQGSVEKPLAELARGIHDALQERGEQGSSISPELSSLIGENVRSVVAEQEKRLAEMTEVMVKTTQAAEAALRAIQEERAQTQGAVENTTRIANLEIFPGTSEISTGQLSDAGALDSPGLGMESDERVREAVDSDRILNGYTFDEFLVGPANTFTLKAARALGEQLTLDFNPLYVCGDEGLGKTHLLNAVGNALLGRNPDLRVAYVSTSHFAGAFATALKHDELSEFRDRFCRWDVLLIDDIQFLAGRTEAQEELFHIFNALVHEGRVVVIAGDRSPDKLPEFQKGLASRFSSGIVTKLRPPEMDVRLAILKRYAEMHRVAVPEEILSLVATRIATDVRKMRGALRKVIAYAKLVEQDITREMANEVLDSLGADDAA